MSIEEGAKYVAAAYAVILAVVIVYYAVSARRVSALAARRRSAQGRDRASGRRPAPATEPERSAMAHLSAILVWIAFLLYCGAFAMFLVAVFGRHDGLNRVGLWLVVGGWVLQTVAIVVRVADAGRVPVVGAYESLGAVAWSVVTVYLVLEFFTRVKTVGLYVTPVVIGLLVAALIEYEAPRELTPALRSDIVTLHVIVMLTAVGALYVAGGAALIYLFEEWQLKRHRLGGVLGRLPSLATLDRLSLPRDARSACPSSPWAWPPG